MTYAEIIQKAIETSPFKRLTLCQIYDWFIKYVPYFRTKTDTKTSFGWKNSIRHNLSLHKKFLRIQNSDIGKSSWWTIDITALNSEYKSELDVSKKPNDSNISLLNSSCSVTSSSSTFPSYNDNYNNGNNTCVSETQPLNGVFCNQCKNSYECVCKRYSKNSQYNHNNNINHSIIYTVIPNNMNYGYNHQNMMNASTDHKQNYYTQNYSNGTNNNDWRNLDINDVITYEKTLNGGTLDFNKDYMFEFMDYRQFAASQNRMLNCNNNYNNNNSISNLNTTN